MEGNEAKKAIRPSVIFPLTTRTRRAFDYRERLEKAWENSKKCRQLKGQVKAVDLIQKEIAKRKREFLCHQRERMERKKKERQELEKDILIKYGVVLKNESLRNKIVGKLTAHDKLQQKNLKLQNKRMKNIVQKLLTEIKEKEQTVKPKIWKTVAKRPESPLEMEEEFPKIYNQEEENIEKELDENWEDIEEAEITETKPEKEKPTVKKEGKKKEGKKKEAKKDDKKSKKSEKTPKDKTSTKSKEKGKKGPEEFVMPFVPTTNPRTKLKPEDSEKMAELLQNFKECKDFLDDRKKFYAKKEFSYPHDKSFSSKPETVTFSDFENGKTYRRKVIVYNNSSEMVYCKFREVHSEDDLAAVLLSVKEVHVHKIPPGLCFYITVCFRPNDLKYVEGHLIFTTRRVQSQDLKQFGIHFKCEVASVKINVQPVNIIFENVPIWKVETQKKFRPIQIENNMIKECTLIIRNIKPKSDKTEENEKQDEKSDKNYTESTEPEKKESLNFIQNEISENSLNTVELLINECIQHISNTFIFDTYFLCIPPKTTTHVKIFLKTAAFVGVLQEQFEFEFLENAEGKYSSLKTEEITVQVETTGKFIKTEIDYLDYNICILDSVYQQSFTVYNVENFCVKIGFQLPSSLKDFFSFYPQTLFLKGNRSEDVSLRFIPRKEILDKKIKYYDPYTRILSFPVRINQLLAKDNSIPPTVLTVYAILTEPDGIKLEFTDDKTQKQDGLPVIHMGLVTTHETAVADFEIKNISSVRQQFGFLKLPELISIMPDFGFGTIEPNEVQKLQILLSPNIWDMITDDNEHTTGPLEKIYKVTCNTLYKIGSVKEKPRQKKLPDLLEIWKNPEKFFEETYSKLNPTLFKTKPDNEITNLNDPKKTDLEEATEMYFENPTENDNENFENLAEEEEEEVITKTLSILVKVTLLDYWTELSHQFVIFPDTPLGSFSTMGVQISAQNNSSIDSCVCGFVTKNPDFECHFEITGGCEEIFIEPICGDLKNGEGAHLLLTAKPTFEQHILQQTAKICKVQKLESNKQKGKGKGKPAKPTKPPNPDNVSLHNCDYYPAEKEISRTVQPYTLKTKLTCCVTFPESLNKATEILYLTAECKVIRPEFVTNLITQYIDFGPTAISTRPKNIIAIENISRTSICPKISPVCPTGAFSCAMQRNIQLETEHVLQVPLTFAPTEKKIYTEYLEIKSGNTIETLMISGEGIEPDFEFVPKFTVCRIAAKFGKFSECVFQINNKCKAPLSLQLLNTCELKGKIQAKPVIAEATEDATAGKGKGKGDKKKADKTSKKTKSAKPQKPKKFSDNLLPDEEYSLEGIFVPYTEQSQFRLMAANNDLITVEPLAKTKIKIRFERPLPPVEITEKPVEKGKKKKDQSSKSKKSKETKMSPEEKGMKYVAKYNIMLGNIVFVKDFIIIAEFT